MPSIGVLYFSNFFGGLFFWLIFDRIFQVEAVLRTMLLFHPFCFAVSNIFAVVAQLAEHFHGKEGVRGPNPRNGSSIIFYSQKHVREKNIDISCCAYYYNCRIFVVSKREE
jgi:hypothetical protein